MILKRPTLRDTTAPYTIGDLHALSEQTLERIRSIANLLIFADASQLDDGCLDARAYAKYSNLTFSINSNILPDNPISST